MKKGLLTVVLMIIFWAVAGCDRGLGLPSDIIPGMTMLKIYRTEENRDTSLLISAKSVDFDYHQRVITVDGLTNITGKWYSYSQWVVPEIEVREGKFIIKIPKDTAYHIYIGENYHYLPVIVKEK